MGRAGTRGDERGLSWLKIPWHEQFYSRLMLNKNNSREYVMNKQFFKNQGVMVKNALECKNLTVRTK